MSESTIITLIIATVVVFALMLFNRVRVLVQLKPFVISLEAKDSRRKLPSLPRSRYNAGGKSEAQRPPEPAADRESVPKQGLTEISDS